MKWALNLESQKRSEHSRFALVLFAAVLSDQMTLRRPTPFSIPMELFLFVIHVLNLGYKNKSSHGPPRTDFVSTRASRLFQKNGSDCANLRAMTSFLNTLKFFFHLSMSPWGGGIIMRNSSVFSAKVLLKMNCR